MATNISAITATEMTFPYDITQNAGAGTGVIAGGAGLWFTAVAGRYDQVWSIIAWSDNGANYAPNVHFWQGAAVAPVVTPSWGTTDNSSRAVLLLAVTPGTRYFIQITHASVPDPPTSDLVLSVISSAQLQRGAVAGFSLITDDEFGFPAAMIDPETGAVVGYVPDMPHGEVGAALPNGMMIIEDSTEAQLWRYTPRTGFAFVRNIDDSVFDGGARPISSNNVDRFYVSKDSVVTALSPEGVVGDSWTIGATLRAMAITDDDTILYYVLQSTLGTIKRWDLVNDIALSDFATYGGGYEAGLDLFLLPDGTLLVWWRHASDPSLAVRYHADGSIVRTINIE